MMENVGAQMRTSRDGTALVGTGADSSFALAQCYGDLSSDDCLRCFAEARTILPSCFPNNGGRIYLDGCYMRFQNYSFFDEYTGPDDTIVCGNTTRKSTPFQDTVRQAVSNAVTDSLRNKGYFAREDILVSGNGNTSVYVMAECWRTLIPDLCRACLMNASASITKCLPWSAGRALNTGCFMRYSDTNFLNPLTVKKKKNSHLSVILPIVFTVVVFSFALVVYAWRKKKKSHHKVAQVNKDQKQDSDLPFFSLNEVVKATRNFSIDNKLGQGGFGAVYKGVLEEGGEIAVKRLSKTSRQGLPEFQNEVTCIAKLQHRNLVKLLGCCVQGEEMMLIYEYMPNKSLDSFLFDKNNCMLLDWPQRYHIINGIARGLLYLHQDSRLRIIHRDLKASNILLDSNMNPKISDFGLARMFKEYETEANTNKVVGTL
ncbi:S-locus glycoprotein domain-containing protein [Artemisia annua]|nr:S-locus glycoprotein domain-containing protein [Artemisia annua]